MIFNRSVFKSIAALAALTFSLNSTLALAPFSHSVLRQPSTALQHFPGKESSAGGDLQKELIGLNPKSSSAGYMEEAVKAATNLAQLISQRLDSPLTQAWFNRFFADGKNEDIRKGLDSFLEEIISYRGIEPEKKGTIARHYQELLSLIETSKRLKKATIGKLKALLSIYDAISQTNLHSPCYVKGEPIAFVLDGQKVAKIGKDESGEKCELFDLNVERIFKLLVDEKNQAEVSRLFKDFRAEALLKEVNYVYDGANNAVALTPIFSDPRLNYVTTLGGVRYHFGSIKRKGKDYSGLMREAQDLSSAMLWKNIIAGLPYQGVKTDFLAPENKKEQVLKRWADAVTDLGLFGRMLGGPDMNITPEDIKLVVETAQKRYLMHLERELLLLISRGLRMEELSAEGYEEELRKIEQEFKIVFMHEPQIEKMRAELLKMVKAKTIKDAFTVKKRRPKHIEFSEDIRGVFYKILGSIVAGGTWEMGALPLPDISPTGYGACFAVELAVEHLKQKGVIPAERPNNEISIRIQGAGDVGGAAAYFLALMGYKIVAISDVNGVVYKRDGFSLEALKALYIKNIKERDVTVDLAKDADEVSGDPEALWRYEADVTMPSAIAYAINQANLDLLKGKTYAVIEPANNSFKYFEEAIHAMGILAIVGYTCNQGGILCCFAEDFARHYMLARELAGDERGNKREILEELYREIEYKVRSVISVILALAKENEAINPTQIGQLLGIAILNKKAEIDRLYRQSDEKYKNAIDTIISREITQEGSFMVTEKALAVAVSRLAYKEVLGYFMQKLGIKEPAKPSGRPELLSMMLKDLPATSAISKRFKSGGSPAEQAQREALARIVEDKIREMIRRFHRPPTDKNVPDLVGILVEMGMEYSSAFHAEIGPGQGQEAYLDYLSHFMTELLTCTDNPEVYRIIQELVRPFLDKELSPEGFVAWPIAVLAAKTEGDTEVFKRWVKVIQRLIDENLEGVTKWVGALENMIKDAGTPEELEKELIERGFLQSRETSEPKGEEAGREGPKASSSGSVYWRMHKKEKIPATMLALCSLPGMGPVLTTVSTDFIQRPVEVLKVPERAKVVLIKIDNAGVCRSDIDNLTKPNSAEEHNIAGLPLGHEGGGIIKGVSPGVDVSLLGKHVAIESHLPWTNLWDIPWYSPKIAKDRFSIVGYDPAGAEIPSPGTWTQYMVMPLENVYPLPEEVRDILKNEDGKDRYSILEPSGNAVYAILLAQQRLKGAHKPKVIIVGLGWQGRLMIKVAQMMGMEVAGVDINKEMIERTIKLGLGSKQTIFSSKDSGLNDKITAALGGKADVIIDACGATEVRDEISGYLKDEGLFLLFGLLNDDQLVSTTGITLRNFVIGQMEETVAIAGQGKMTLLGACGRSRESWDWLIREIQKDPELAKVILSDVNDIGSMLDLITLLYTYNKGDKGPLNEALADGKIVMSGFPENLNSRPLDIPALSRLFPGRRPYVIPRELITPPPTPGRFELFQGIIQFGSDGAKPIMARANREALIAIAAAA